MIRIFCLTFMLFGAFFCGYAQTDTSFSLHGNIAGLTKETPLYLVNESGEDTIAHAITKGEFVFKGKIPFESGFYFIRMDTLVSKKISKALLLVNAPLEMSTSMKEWPEVKLAGSEPHDEYTQVLKMFAEWNKELSANSDEWLKIYNASLKAKDNNDSIQLKRELEDVERQKSIIEEDRKKGVRLFIDEHRNSLYIAHLIKKMENLFDFEETKVFYDKLSPRAKASSFGIMLNRRLKYGKMRIGELAGNFNMPALNGDSLSLKDVLRKGKFTLLDFWASWCKPCREETPNVRKAYNLYHEKGFNVLSISMDTNIKDWKKAIAKDTMPWYHVIDKKENSVAEAYNVTSIPETFLLDTDGRLIAIGLRGNALMEKLKELIGSKLER